MGVGVQEYVVGRLLKAWDEARDFSLEHNAISLVGMCGCIPKLTPAFDFLGLKFKFI
jgi:hypothetical protein